MVHAHCRSTSSILLLITGSICCCSAVICCRVASGIPSCTASVTGSVDWAGLLPQRLRFRAGAGASELPAASSVLAPHRLRRLPSTDSGAAAASADSGARGEASVMRRETAAARSRTRRPAALREGAKAAGKQIRQKKKKVSRELVRRPCGVNKDGLRNVGRVGRAAPARRSLARPLRFVDRARPRTNQPEVSK